VAHTSVARADSLARSLRPPGNVRVVRAPSRCRLYAWTLEATWATLPMLGILALGVLLITYVPWLTLGLLQWMGRA